MDYEEKKRKKEARMPHILSDKAQKARGLKAKILNRKRHVEKIEMKKQLRMHDQKTAINKPDASAADNNGAALPPYLMDRSEPNRSKVLSNLVKEKRKEKAGKWSVPLPQVKGLAQDEIFKSMKSGKRQKKCWKRMITKATFVGEGFTRNPPKMERFIRPAALRMKKANVTHPELKTTFQLPIIAVKKNPQGPMYSQLGVLTKGTVIEVNVSELGLVTTGGKVVWGKYAQITNNPENDGCINSVLLV